MRGHAFFAAVVGLLASALLLPELASANYPWRIPNGYTNRTAATGGRCGVCHVSSAGGGARTPFGEDFRNNSYTWNAELAEKDSDGDGYSNGQELGDPFALWSAGSASNDPPPPSVPVYPDSYRANPGTSGSQPSETTMCSDSDRNDCDNNANCSRNSFNGIGDWTCTCRAGYEPTSRNGYTRTNSHDFTQGTQGNDLYNIVGFAAGCRDIDCSPNPCGVGTCTNLSPPSTYTCNCPAGYSFSGGTCVLTNACTAGTDDCDPVGGICSTGTGCRYSYCCTCAPGYTAHGDARNGTGDDCRDIDECAARPCGNGLCIQTRPPGYTCSCNGGYQFDGTTCVDIDECESDPCDANATCANSVGSFRCTCNAGYAGDGFTCADVDECADGSLNDCDLNATCTNDVGSFSCACNEHWMGDGRTCADVNDCATGAVVCGANEDCINPMGAPGYCECSFGFSRPTPEAECAVACGNGQRTPGEGCDDGNTEPGDGCDETCRTERGWSCTEGTGDVSTCVQTCGDGFIDPPDETCDEGPDNSDTDPTACRMNCRLPGCGDGLPDDGEACDDGLDNSDTDPDACRSDCRPAYCGDGVVDEGETCDPGGGSELDSASCNAGCRPDLGTPTFDGGTSDGGMEPEGDEGCGCRVVGTERSSRGWLALLLGALIAIRRRRR